MAPQGGSLHLIIAYTLPVASPHTLWLTGCMLPWDNTVIRTLPLLWSSTQWRPCVLSESVRCVYERGAEEMSLPVWRQVKVNKLSLVRRDLNHNTGCLLYSRTLAGSRKQRVETTCLCASTLLLTSPRSVLFKWSRRGALHSVQLGRGRCSCPRLTVTR